MLLYFNERRNHWGLLLRCRLGLSGYRRGIANKLPGDTDAAGPWSPRGWQSRGSDLQV